VIAVKFKLDFNKEPRYNMFSFKAFNEAVARRATLMVGTMWCVYAFALLVLIPLFVPSSQMVIMYVSSSFLQLILLPLIMVGQSVLSRKAEERAESDHFTLLDEFEIIKDMHKELHELLRKQDEQSKDQ